MKALRLAVVVPALNEATGIAGTLLALAPLRQRGVKLVLVDGGSTDATVALAAPLVDAVVSSARGRALQMNAGVQHLLAHVKATSPPTPLAALPTGPDIEAFLFLHADTQLPAQADVCIARALAAGARWGRFDVCIQGRPRMLRCVAAFMNLRSRWTGIATGDQAMFVERALFEQVGGFPVQPLMEDIELSKRLRALAKPACLRERVLTSGRRWEERGVWRTIVLMWRLRWRYWRGVSAHVLAREYR